MTVQAAGRITVLSELDAHDAGFDVTDARTLAALRAAEDAHFWHRTRNELIAEGLLRLGVGPGARVIELGCGGGCVSAHLSAQGYDVVGVDGHRALIELAAERAPRARFWVHDLSKGTSSLPEREFDAAGLFDVIEHLQAPGEAIAQALRLVRVGGLVVGTVPAMPRLWSRVDEQAGHRKRYVRKTLLQDLAVARQGEVVELRTFNRLLVPVMMVQRRVVSRRADRGGVSEANLSVPPAWLNGLSAAALRMERRLSVVLDRTSLQGASLWFAVRKRGDGLEGVPRGGVEPPT